MSLVPAQVEQLGELLVKHLDDEGKELDNVVKRNLGSGLFVEYAGRGPFVNVVSQLLTKTEQRGSTVKLFAGVIKRRPDLTDMIAKILPEAAAAAPKTAEQVAEVLDGVSGVHARLESAAVRKRILKSFDDLERVVIDLDLLARYKALHDCLHDLQVKHLRQVTTDAKRLREDPLANDNLSEYLHQLQIQASRARTAAEGLPDTPGERDVQMRWISALDAIINDLRAALTGMDNKAATKAVYGLKAILRKEPSELDHLLVITARRVPLSRLLDTLEDIATDSRNGAKERLDLSNAIVALQHLIPDQMGLIAEHTDWQQVARDFWQADDALQIGNSDSLEEFQYHWDSLWNKIRTIIADDPKAPWATELNRQANDLFTFPLTPPVPEHVKSRFGLFQRDAMFQFFKVDQSLHRQCNEIIKLGEPLQRLLKDASNDNH
jgi:hypothetical protein